MAKCAPSTVFTETLTQEKSILPSGAAALGRGGIMNEEKAESAGGT